MVEISYPLLLLSFFIWFNSDIYKTAGNENVSKVITLYVNWYNRSEIFKSTYFEN